LNRGERIGGGILSNVYGNSGCFFFAEEGGDGVDAISYKQENCNKCHNHPEGKRQTHDQLWEQSKIIGMSASAIMGLDALVRPNPRKQTHYITIAE
jgi:hypothetical protein